ncbi:MAG: transporter [bacterium]|nr:transporter [bacterium]
MKNYFIKIAIAVLFMGLLFGSLSAQNFLFQPLPKNTSELGLRFMRPNFERGDDLSLLSGTYDFYLNIPMNREFNIFASLPFSTFSAEDEDSESGIGNIYIGFQTKPSSGLGSKASLSFGVFLPTATDEMSPAILGAYSNYYELQKYVPDMLTVYGNYSFLSNQSRGAIFGVELGPNLFIPTKEGGQVELFAHYGISGGFKLNKIMLSAELTGLAIISEDIDDFADRFIHSLAFGAQWTGGTIRPTIFYQIYLDEEYRDFIDGVLGIKFDVSLP